MKKRVGEARLVERVLQMADERDIVSVVSGNGGMMIRVDRGAVGYSRAVNDIELSRCAGSDGDRECGDIATAIIGHITR